MCTGMPVAGLLADKGLRPAAMGLAGLAMDRMGKKKKPATTDTPTMGMR